MANFDYQILKYVYLIAFIFVALWPLKFLVSSFKNGNWYLTVSGIIVLIHPLLGLFLSTTIFWVFPVNKVNSWFQYIFFLIFCFTTIVCLLKYIPKNDGKLFKWVLNIFSILCGMVFFLSWLAIFRDSVYNTMYAGQHLWRWIHIDLFSLVFLLIAFRPLIKRCNNDVIKMSVDSFIFAMSFFHFFNLLFNYIGPTFYNFATFESSLLIASTGLLFIYSIYLLYSKEFVLNKNYSLLNLAWIFPLVIILIVLDGYTLQYTDTIIRMTNTNASLNQINFFNFIYLIVGDKGLIEFTINSPYAYEDYDCCIYIPVLFYVLWFAYMAIVIYLLVWLGETIQKHWKPQWLSDNIL